MNHLDSDLEEGEILDDSPSSSYTSNTTKNHKKLPRRYVLHKSKNTTHKGKHKKNCKHANPSTIRYHARKLAKLKKIAKLKDCKKKSCSHKNVYIADDTASNSNKSVFKHMFPKNGHTHHSHTENIKNPLKQHNVNRNSSKSESPEIEIIADLTNCTFSEMLSRRKSMQATQKMADDSMSYSKLGPKLFERYDVTAIPENNCEEKSNISTVSLKSSEANSGESEDEEELRRIALATCAKRVADTKISENSLSRPEAPSCPYIIPESSENKLPHTSYPENSNEASDNYEVVDMDLDEEMQSTLVNSENDNLFVIDTEPQINYQEESQKNSVPAVQSVEDSSDEEFNADILRAELINNLLRKRSALENTISSEKSRIISDTGASTLKSKEQTNPVKRTESVNIPPDKPVQKSESNDAPKRLVISLKDESSSSEESDEEAKTGQNSDNPVASIVALISDIRQKSDKFDKNGDQVNTVPGALSCLSKAQQQEYSSLVKILAKKKKKVGENQDKSSIIHSPLTDLKSLENKLLAVRATLNKKKELMSYLYKEAAAKKRLYMKSKNAAVHFKEKYIAAEKVRRIKLQEWSKAQKNHQVVEKSVSSLESKITQLQNLCSKLGATLEGQNYNLPTRSETS